MTSAALVVGALIGPYLAVASAGCSSTGSVAAPVPTSAPTEIHFPRYPEAARKRRIEGMVTIAASIAPDGAVVSASVVNSAMPILDRASISAAKLWRFQPEPNGATRTADLTFEFILVDIGETGLEESVS